MKLCIAALSGLLLWACVESERHIPSSAPPSFRDAGACLDRDGDGFGEGCAAGGDCNDDDEKIHVGCAQCVTPQQGCPCDESSKPVSCYLTPTTSDAGTPMCHEGTRYCRRSEWSSCESVVSYPKPAAAAQDPQALINPAATPQQCNDCAVTCFVVRDKLDPVDAGITSATHVQVPPGGGLSLEYTLPDASTPDASVFDPSKCVLGTAPDHDCDGIPDMYDPYPNMKPFATANPTLFLDIAPGETGTGVVKLAFYLNSADVYFLIDQTGSMLGERDQLKADLVTGNFINDAAYACADYDFDFLPNNELKTQGIIGAIRCIIRDANFGLGYFREIPFANAYATTDSIAYRNMQDITSTIPLVTSAIAKLNVVGNYDWPEDSMTALYSVITGNGMYFGTTRPGVPTRAGCPSLTYGYPCFRNAAIPIVLLFTDAQFHNGPSTNTYAYSASNLGITSGTSSAYASIASTNETYASAADLGDLTTKLNSFIGSTVGMTSDFNHSQVSCNSTTYPASPDAMFKFTLSATTTVKADTNGSDFDTTLTIFKGAPKSVATLPTYPNTNDTGATAYSFGDAANGYVQAVGNSSTLVSDYSANDVSCSAATGAKDATFSFNLSQATRVALDTTGSGFGTVVGLFSGTPVTNSYTAIPNTNDTIASAYAVGALASRNAGFSGDTSAAGITATYTAAQLACSAAAAPADASPDAVYSFTLAAPTRVRVSTEDSTLKTVVALTDNGTAYLTPVASTNTNELEASARDLGVLDGQVLQYTGSTSSMVANYTGSLIGCGSGDTSKDAVYKFTLASTKGVQIDTLASTYDTVLALFRSGVNTGDTAVALPSNTNETGLTAYSIGTVNSKRYIVSGGTTTSMVADYTTAQVGCSAYATSPDAVYKFHLDTPTTVRVDTAGSSIDTVISLHNAALPDLAVTTLASNTNETIATATIVNISSTNANMRYDGTTASMASDVLVDNGAGCSAVGPDAVYKIVVPVGADGNYEVNTIGSSIDTVLGVYPSTIYNPTAPTPVAQASNGETKAAAVNVGAMDGQWKSYTGSTAAMANNIAFASCTATSTTKDAFYSFTVTGSKTISIDTIGSGFDTVIGLFNSTTDAQVGCDNDSGGGVTSKLVATLSTGTYYAVIKAKGTGVSGAYKITFRDTAVSDVTNLLACDNDSGGGVTSKLTGPLTAGTYYAVVKGRLAATKGAYKVAIKALDYIDSANKVTCNDDYNSTPQSRIEQSLNAGDYWVVVKGKSAAAKGSYTLTVQDITTPTGKLDCDDDTVALTSQITGTLTAGTYYVVVKGYGSNNGSYTLNIKDTAAAATTTYQCDYNSGASGTSLIERDLAAGTYRVVVKGKAATDKGAYKLVLRDLTAVPTQRIGCDRNSASSGKSHLEADLGVGTYTVVMKGDTAAGAGAYNLSLRDVSNVTTADAPLLCDNDGGSLNDASAISTSLAAGTYFALVKGYKTTDVGQYQLNIGGGSTTTTAKYVPPTWAQTLAALQAKQARVLTVLSCRDDLAHGDLQGDCVAARTQAKALANATSSLGNNLQPLVFDINGDGSGLSKSVVDGVAALAHYLEMNVSVRIVFDPDPNPGFALIVNAVDAAGDGCSGLVGNEHQHCVPGASPRFEVQFTNPVGAPVPLNSHDPNGGYNFRAELIGNQQFIVDKVPIYIIPRDVTGTTKPVPKVAASGSYWQDVSSSGCTGNQSPDWHDLNWTADIPKGTSVSFSVCASDKSTDLTTCALTPLATVTGGATCTTNANCPNGYCSAQMNCQTITSNTCTTNMQCVSGSSCAAGKCTYAGQPVYIGSVLSGKNYATNLRMNIGMTGNTTDNTSPTVHDWSLNYLCNANL